MQDIAKSVSAYAEQQQDVVRRMVAEAQVVVDELAKYRAMHKKVQERVR